MTQLRRPQPDATRPTGACARLGSRRLFVVALVAACVVFFAGLGTGVHHGLAATLPQIADGQAIDPSPSAPDVAQANASASVSDEHLAGTSYEGTVQTTRTGPNVSRVTGAIIVAAMLAILFSATFISSQQRRGTPARRDDGTSSGRQF